MSQGRVLEIEHQGSRERRIWANRAYLMTKAKQMGAFVDRSGAARGQRNR